MASVITEVIPVAKKWIADYVYLCAYFDLTDKSSIRDCAEAILQSAEWECFRKDNTYNAPLKIVDCWNQTMYRYPFECPIVRYQCDENSICALDGDPHLNSFVESITVSIVQRGRAVKLGSEKTHTKSVKADVVVYYTDHFGINHSFFQNDINQLLLEKANLVVSPEGVLVFFTDKKIIATLACNNGYYWISEHFIDVEGKTVKDIKVCKNYCKVILLDKEGVKHNFKLKFDFDLASYQVLIPKVSKM